MVHTKSNLGGAALWHDAQLPTALLMLVVPRLRMRVPCADTDRRKNSQSLVGGLKPACRLTIASPGTSWITVPTGKTPPVAERATATASARCPLRLPTTRSPTWVMVLTFKKSAAVGAISGSVVGGAVVDAFAVVPAVVPGRLDPPQATKNTAATTLVLSAIATHDATRTRREETASGAAAVFTVATDTTLRLLSARSWLG